MSDSVKAATGDAPTTQPSGSVEPVHVEPWAERVRETVLAGESTVVTVVILGAVVALLSAVAFSL